MFGYVGLIRCRFVLDVSGVDAFPETPTHPTNQPVQAYVTPPGSDIKPGKPQATKTRKNSTNPMFDEEVRPRL